MYITIEGCIGAGKTTTARMSAERLGYELLLERTEAHPFLNDFYADSRLSALETEVAFVLIHYHQLHCLGTAEHLVTDFSPVKDFVFAEMNLTAESDTELFDRVYSELVDRIPTPDLVVYLELPIEELMRRIRERGRAYEMYVATGYLERLQESYERNMPLLGRNTRTLQVHAGERRDEVADRVVSLIRKFSLEST